MRYIFNKNLFCVLSLLSCFSADARLPQYKGEAALDALIEKFDIKCNDMKKLKKHIIQTIYTNKGRQSLANWMKDRRPRKGLECGGGYNDILEIKEDSRFKEDTPFFNVLKMLVKAGKKVDNAAFSKFTNLIFPCWSGTLTCYMHKPAGRSLAKVALEYNRVSQACKWILANDSIDTVLQPLMDVQNCLKDEVEKKKVIEQVQIIREKSLERDKILPQNHMLVKVMGVLFALELIDDWKQVQSIVENDKLSEPHANNNRSPECLVHVPNTAAYCVINGHRELIPDCQFTTLRQLLAILFQGNYDKIKNEKVSKYLQEYASSSEKIEIISGETDFEKHEKWAACLPDKIRNDLSRSAKWIVNAVAVLCGSDEVKGDSFEELSISLKLSICKIRKAGGEGLEVKVYPWDENKFCGSWPTEKIMIKDALTKKCIIIGSGGDRNHCEIMDIR